MKQVVKMVFIKSDSFVDTHLWLAACCIFNVFMVFDTNNEKAKRTRNGEANYIYTAQNDCVDSGAELGWKRVQ